MLAVRFDRKIRSTEYRISGSQSRMFLLNALRRQCVRGYVVALNVKSTKRVFSVGNQIHNND